MQGHSHWGGGGARGTITPPAYLNFQAKKGPKVLVSNIIGIAFLGVFRNYMDKKLYDFYRVW